MVDTNERRTLVMRGDSDVKFADVVSSDHRIAMIFMLDGCPNDRICVSFMIFQNVACYYPIWGITDAVPGVCHRKVPKGWMDWCVFREWFGKWRIFQPLRNEQKRVIFIDNASGHAMSDDVQVSLPRSNTELMYLPKNDTELCRPADSVFT